MTVEEHISPTSLTAATTPDQLRVIVRVARLYHEKGLKQQQIASKLGLSQAKVSRMLKLGVELGLVRTVVTVPSLVFPELEERIEQLYDLDQAVIIDTPADSDALLTRLGIAAARHLETTLQSDDIVGISSWSDSLLQTARSLRPSPSFSCQSVVQLVGGVGNTEVQMLATEIIQLFSLRLHAEPVFMLTPAVLGSRLAQETLGADPMVKRVSRLWNDVTVALFGVGALAPSPLLARSGNSYRSDDRRILQEAGAVGDVCLRYFDADGAPIVGEFDDRVMAISRSQLMNVPTRIAVAAGENKVGAIRGCLRNHWATTIVTDIRTAELLV